MSPAESTIEPSADVADELFEVLGQIRRQSRRVSGHPFEASPLNGSQVELVRLVRRHPDVSVADAAAKLGLAANTVSTLVRQLTDAGVVERVADPADRRVARLRLSPDASRRVDAFRARRSSALTLAYSALSPADRQSVEAALPSLVRLVDELRTLEGSTTER
ncbi:DNA-binding MarR family transcriptional regulator [Rhodococcus sp. 27YEA15]|uniref:MarR family winged helix-turn-helix transcriptional regulator n=1 Tax=Rhodococcus sp. 27YEA15 TaxID=3156259 RepID=UPI003C7A5374